MIGIGERLKKLRELSGQTQPDFANSLGLSASSDTIYRWEREKAFPPADVLALIAEKYEINIHWLTTGTGPMKAEQSLSGMGMYLDAQHPPGRKATSSLPEEEGEVVLESPALNAESSAVQVPADLRAAALDVEKYSLIPLLESRVTGGPEGEVLFEEVADYLPFKRDWIKRLVGRSSVREKALLLVRVRGDSMSPTINQGEVVLIDTYETERLQILDGRIYLVILPDGSATLKRLVLKKEDAGRFKLLCLSDNTPDYRPFDFDLDPSKTLKHYILGRVRWCGKEFD